MDRVERLKGLTNMLKLLQLEREDCDRVIEKTIEFNDQIANPEKYQRKLRQKNREQNELTKKYRDMERAKMMMASPTLTKQ